MECYFVHHGVSLDPVIQDLLPELLPCDATIFWQLLFWLEIAPHKSTAESQRLLQSLESTSKDSSGRGAAQETCMRLSSRLPAVAAALAAFLAACLAACSSTKASAQAVPADARLGWAVHRCYMRHSRRVHIT